MTTSSPSITLTGLDPITGQLGTLIGLLSSIGSGSYTLNTDWFSHPSFQNIAVSSSPILTLLGTLLGSPIANSPDGRLWYSITQQGQPTGAYVVLPAANSGSLAIIGLGLMNFTTESGTEITAHLYLPLIELPLPVNPMITGEGDNPIEIGLNIQNPPQQLFTVDDVSFDGLNVVGQALLAGTGSSFQVEFSNLQPSTAKNTYQTLSDLLSVKDWLNTVISSPAVTTWLNTKMGTTAQTPGLLLTDLGLLLAKGSQYLLADLSGFLSQSPLTILETFFFKILSSLADNTHPLVPLTDGGIFVMAEVGDQGTAYYGLRSQIGNSNANSSSYDGVIVTDLSLQFGQWFTGETQSDDSWLHRARPSLVEPEPGIALYLLQTDSNNQPTFNPKLELSSLGFNLQGGNNSALINLSGYTIKGFEARFYLSLDPGNPNPIPWAVALRCDQLGLPLGTGLTRAGANNPVAQNLLSTGALGDPQVINPKFSVAIAYGSIFNVQFYDDQNVPQAPLWLTIQKAFGPLNCQKIGASWQDSDKLLSLLYYGSVTLASLNIGLEGLSVGIPVTTPDQLSTYAFDLKGLSITLKTDPLEISGGLMKTQDAQNDWVYSGEALIKAKKFSIAALGSYASLNGNPSLFIFAFINTPIGGPPAFFVTGLCGGFGYNRSLILPAVNKIQNFPFVSGLTDPSNVGGVSAKPAAVLGLLGDLVPPTQGEDWLAVGVQFTSFELIQSHALLVAEFGKDLQIALLGLSIIQLPAKDASQPDLKPFAYVEMGLEVVLKPKEGTFSAIAVLKPSSYVIDPNCHLTGGFAFCVWFGDNVHSGDFVLSIGGYHPRFTPPAWYPKLPRLGFNWPISQTLFIAGDAYFALTPSCIMGGGRLEALYHDGDLQAWFIAHADFLMSWKPFYYTVSIGVSIGVSYNVHFLFISGTIRIELGAELDLWGPPTGGQVQISLWIISFTIGFGPAFNPPQTCTWDDFQSFLPHSRPQPANPSAANPTAAIAATEPSALAVCNIQVSQGLYTQDDGGHWYIRPDEFVFSVDTAVPLTEIDLIGPNGSTPILPSNIQDYFVGIRPMGISQLSSVATLQISSNNATPAVLQDLVNNWQETATLQAVSEALWGEPLPAEQTPPPASNLLPDRLVGLNSIQLKQNPPVNPIVVDAVQALEYVIIDENSTGIPVYLPLSSATVPVNVPPQVSNQVLTTLTQTLTNTTVVAKRTSLFNALADLGIDTGSNGDLSALQANVGVNYQALPMVGTPDGIST